MTTLWIYKNLREVRASILINRKIYNRLCKNNRDSCLKSLKKRKREKIRKKE